MPRMHYESRMVAQQQQQQAGVLSSPIMGPPPILSPHINMTAVRPPGAHVLVPEVSVVRMHL